MNILICEKDAKKLSELSGVDLPGGRMAIDFKNGGSVRRYDFGELEESLNISNGNGWEGNGNSYFHGIPLRMQWGFDVLFTAFL